MIKNSEVIKAYREALDTAKGILACNDLRDAIKGWHVKGEIATAAFCEAMGFLDEAEKFSTDPRPHQKKASRLKDSLITGNWGLIRKIARRELGSKSKIEANLEEAMQEGAMGLVRAIETFDESKGAFSNFAGYWIRYYVQLCALRQGDFVKQRNAKMPAKIARQVNVFRNLHGREPTANEMGVDDATWTKWLSQTHMVSVDASGDDDEPLELIDERSEGVSADLDKEMRFQERLEAMFATMSPRHVEILKGIFVEGKSQTDVANINGVSTTLVNRLKIVIERKLRLRLQASA